MVTIKLYLDTRACKVDKPAPLKVSFIYQRITALLPLGIKLFGKMCTFTHVIEHSVEKTKVTKGLKYKRVF